MYNLNTQMKNTVDKLEEEKELYVSMKKSSNNVTLLLLGLLTLETILMEPGTNNVWISVKFLLGIGFLSILSNISIELVASYKLNRILKDMNGEELSSIKEHIISIKEETNIEFDNKDKERILQLRLKAENLCKASIMLPPVTTVILVLQLNQYIGENHWLNVAIIIMISAVTTYIRKLVVIKINNVLYDRINKIRIEKEEK